MASGQQPQQFGKYTLIERIAIGGMAEVYRAKTFGAAGFERELVVKRILRQFSGDEAFVRMFIDEGRIASRLHHANIVQIFDFDRVELPEGPRYYLAMELVEGADLRHVLEAAQRRGRPLPLGVAVHVAVEVLKGLHYAHTRTDGVRALEIVHRDVSPHNVLLSYSGEVKLSDFGIAKAAQRASVTSNGAVKGKLGYMSPEQLAGRHIDARTDLYALGIVLYEMVTGTRLYTGDSDIEIIAKIRDGNVTPAHRLNPEVQPDLAAALSRLLAHEPEARYPTAQDAAKALAGTSVYSANAAIALGELVTELFPQRPSDGAASHISSPADPPAVFPVERAHSMSQPPSSGNPPNGDAPASGAATVMLEAPSPEALKAASASSSPAPATRPVSEMATAILDGNSAEMQAVQAQIAAARSQAPSGPSVPAAAKPVSEMATAILDGSSAEMQAVQAQIAAARSQAPSGPSVPAASKPVSEMATAILDGSSAEMQAVQAQIAAARSQNAGGEQRTQIAGMAAPTTPPSSAGVSQPRRPSQSLAPLPVPSGPSPWLRWIVGPLLAVVAAVATVYAADLLLPAATVKQAATPPPPPPPAMGWIQLNTQPSGASVRLDGKPYPHFTPTRLEQPADAAPVHLTVTAPGYKPVEQDVIFAQEGSTLTLTLDKADPVPVAAPPPESKKPAHVAVHPAAAKKPAEKPAERARDDGFGLVGDKGTLGVFVKPYAKVRVDGVLAGQTPIGNLSLSAGKHVIELSNDDLGKHEKVRVTVKPGENPEVRRDWTK